MLAVVLVFEVWEVLQALAGLESFRAFGALGVGCICIRWDFDSTVEGRPRHRYPEWLFFFALHMLQSIYGPSYLPVVLARARFHTCNAHACKL